METKNKYYIKVIFFSGTSLLSKFIKFFTRSKFSHVGFLIDDKRTLEAWKHKKDSVCWRLTDDFRKYHTKGTPITIIHIPVSKQIYDRFMSSVDFVDYIRVPYDYVGVIAFVLPFKVKVNGHWFCSEGTYTILKYVGLLHTDCSEWKVSPDILYSIITSLDNIKVEESTV